MGEATNEHSNTLNENYAKQIWKIWHPDKDLSKITYLYLRNSCEGNEVSNMALQTAAVFAELVRSTIMSMSTGGVCTVP